MKNKKFISLLMSLVLIISSISFNSMLSFASDTVAVYSETISASAGDNIKVPVYIKNNSGLLGVSLKLKFNSDEFTYAGIEYGEIFDFEVVHPVNSKTKGEILVSGDNSNIEAVMRDDGLLFTVEFETSTTVSKETVIIIENDVAYDTNFDFVNLDCKQIQVQFDLDSLPCIYSERQFANQGDIICIPVKIKNNKGLNTFNINFSFDDTKLKAVSTSVNKKISGNYAGDTIKLGLDEFQCIWSSIEDTYLDGELLYLNFEVLTTEELSTTIGISGDLKDIKSSKGAIRLPIFEDITVVLNHTPQVTELKMNSVPTKNIYELFEEFDASGLVIEATKDDGSVEIVTDYTVTGFETNSVGTKTVVISYGGKSVSFDVEVAHTHTWSEWQTVFSPNCLDKGSEKRVCSVCKETEMRDVDPLGHNWEEDFTVDIQPKCETAGSKSIHCSRCDVMKDVTSIDPIGHDYESSITKATTCTENGIKTFVCKNDSSHTYTEEIQKLGHNYVASVTKEPTCEEKGIKTFVCSNDSSHIYTEDINPIGHSFELTKTIKATCTEDGKEIYTCKNDLSHTKEIVLKATGHNPSDWIVDKRPTYLEDGSRYKECTVCKTVLSTEAISMLDDITAPEIEIKVKDNSFKSFINSISFGLFFKETVDITITAQDTESGIEKVEYIKTNTPISESDIALQTEWISGESLTVSNDEEFIIYVKATDKQGNISYAGTDGLVVDKTAPVINGITDNAVYCQSVLFTVSDKYIEKVIVNGTEALTDSDEYTLPSADSQYKIVAVDKAGNETVYNVTVNDGHTYGAWVIDKSADCTNNGEKHRICSICGYEENAAIPALGHNYSDSFTIDIEPTCTSAGEKSKHCSRCDDRKDITVVDALGHSFGEWKTIVSPDCTNSGSRQRVCAICGFTETENLNPNGHKWNKDFTIDIPATCTDNGSKSIHCTVCDAVKDSQVIPATGHNLGEYKVIESATCTESGLEKSICSDCDYCETREIPALGHDYSTEFTVDKDATCTENGEKSKHCSRCDSRSDITVVPATGHSYGKWMIVTAPTCTEKGTQQRVCSLCDNIEAEEIAVNGHSWNTDYTIDVEPTCTVEGSKSIHCANCEEIKDTVVIPVIGHNGGVANCHNGAVCDSCGKEYGEIDLSNHSGDVEIRGYIAPTVDDLGYTGDTYCKSCGAKLADGEQIDKLPPEITEPTKPDDSSEAPTDKTDSTTQKSENTTTNTSDNVNKDTSKTSPATGSITVLPIAVSTAVALGLICVVKKKKED